VARLVSGGAEEAWMKGSVNAMWHEVFEGLVLRVLSVAVSANIWYNTAIDKKEKP
jgi:hypothetical protein